MNRLWAGRPRNSGLIPRRQEASPMSETSIPAVGSTQPPAQLVSRINQPALVAYHSFLSSFAGRKACCCTSTHMTS